MSASTYFTGLGVDYPGLGARGMATVLGLAFAVPGISWLLLQRWLDRGDVIARPQTKIEETVVGGQWSVVSGEARGGDE